MKDIAVYVSMDAHSCIAKALEIMGHGSNCVKKFKSVLDLKELVEEDRKQNIQPLAIVGTAGSVNLGKYDDLSSLGLYAREQNIWFHIDAAFGFWILLADQPYRSL